MSTDEAVDQGLQLDSVDADTSKNTKLQEKNIDQDKQFDAEAIALSLQNKLFSAFEKLEEKVCTQLQNIEEKVCYSNTSSVTNTENQSDPVIDIVANTSNITNSDSSDKSAYSQYENHENLSEAVKLLGNIEVPNRETIHRVIPMDELIFPTQLTSFQCDNLKEYLLPRAANKAQALLKILAKRLNNTVKPVKNASAYFSSLVKKLEASTLDLSVVEIEMQIEQLDQKIEAVTLIYNQERNDYYHCQNLVEQERQKHDLDFETAAEKIQMTEILDNYVKKLEEMRTAGQPLFDAKVALTD
jgi:hypothetical protein